MTYQATTIAAADIAGASVTISRAPLVDALKTLCRVIERRNSIPILSTVLIQPAPDGGARLYATDLDMSATVDVTACWTVPGAIALDGQAMLDTLKRCDSADITLAWSGTGKAPRAALTAGEARYQLVSRDAADMPIIADGEKRDGGTFAMPAGELRSLFTDAGGFVSREETRYYLNGVALEGAGGELVAVATHGHGLFAQHMARADAADIVEGFDNGRSVIVPRKAVALVARIIPRTGEGEAVLSLFRCGNGAGFFQTRYGAITIRAKLIDGTFPDWRRALPTADAAGLWSATPSALAAMAKGTKAPAIAFRMGEAGLAASVKIDASSAALAVPGAYVGADHDTGLAPAYLAAAAACFDDAAPLDIACPVIVTDRNGPRQDPFAFTSPAAPGRIVVVMPHRVEYVAPVAAVTYQAERPAPGQAASLFSLSPATGNSNGPRSATDDEVIFYLRDYARRSGLPSMRTAEVAGAGYGVLPQGVTFGEMLDAGSWEAGSYSVPMPGRRQAPALAETLDDAGKVVASSIVPMGKAGLAINAATVQAMTGLEPVKARRGRKPKVVAVASAPLASAAPQIDPAPEAPQEAATAPVSVPVAVETAETPIACPAPLPASPAPISDAVDPVAALSATVAALVARVAALESGEVAPVAADGPVRAPRAVRLRMVRAYLRQRAERQRQTREHAARWQAMARLAEAVEQLQQEAVALRAERDSAVMQAANARRAATDYKREGEAARGEADALQRKRRATAGRLMTVRHKAHAVAAAALASHQRARQAAQALAGAQLASAAAWERVAALSADAMTSACPSPDMVPA